MCLEQNQPAYGKRCLDQVVNRASARYARSYSLSAGGQAERGHLAAQDTCGQGREQHGAPHCHLAPERGYGSPGRWADRASRRGDLDHGVVADAPELPCFVPRTDEGMLPVDGSLHRRAYRGAVAARAREQDRLRTNEAFESLYWVCHC